MSLLVFVFEESGHEVVQMLEKTAIVIRDPSPFFKISSTFHFLLFRKSFRGVPSYTPFRGCATGLV